MTSQNVKNHSRIIPVYHILLYTIVIFCFIASLYRLYTSYIHHSGRLMAAIVLGLSYAILLLTWYARTFALVAQDRAIRAEENMRYFALTGKRLDPTLTTKQIIALRFADDDEYTPLAERAAKEKLTPAEIKKAVVKWRADHYRV